MRPISMAERDMGSDRNRSTMPFFMSSAIPMRRGRGAEDGVLREDPGHQEDDVVRSPDGSFAIAPPNT